MAYRIALCISWFWPVESGAERQARRQAEELHRRGHHVIVLTRLVPGEPAVQTLPGAAVRIERRVRTVDWGPLFGASFLWSMRRALLRLREQIDLVHCHQGLWEAAAAGWARARLGVPVVVQPAASGPFGEFALWQRTRGRRRLQRWVLRCDHFVAISEAIREELLQWGVPEERITRIASGVDVQRYRPGRSPLADTLPPAPRVLFVGRLHRQKNLPVLLRAWREVVRDQRAVLVLVGSGPEEASLRSLAKRLEIEGSLHWAGQQADVLPYLQAADVFCLPSVAEGMSNALLEAMAVGLPAVVTRIGGNVELVEHERTGLLVEPDEPAALAQALRRLLRDRSLRRKLGSAAREQVCARYSIRAVVDAYEALYTRLLRSGPRRTRAGRRRGG